MVEFSTVFLVLIVVFKISYCLDLSAIQSELSEYYQNSTIQSMREDWSKYKISYDNAISRSLQESFGLSSLNVYVKQKNANPITKGFYMSDNAVDLLLYTMTLRSMPHLVMPDVSLDLAYNVIELEASVSPIFVDTTYAMFRNNSEILFPGVEGDPKKYSPFSLQQVQDVGQLVIMAEGCMLRGFALATLQGISVNIGHDQFFLSECKFSVEISTPGLGWPPVIAQYFSKKQGQLLEHLISKPLRNEMRPKLQGALYSIVNITQILGENLQKYRTVQQGMVKKVSQSYIASLIRNLNKNTIQKNNGRIELKDLEMKVNKLSNDKMSEMTLLLSDMYLYGLDTAYSAHNGGPLEEPLGIVETIRFSSMQIRGKANSKCESRSGKYDFAMELNDVEVYFKLVVDKKQLRSSGENPQFDVAGWRKSEFSIIPPDITVKERLQYEALVTGHIINQLPGQIRNHLMETFGKDLPNGESYLPNTNKPSEKSDENFDVTQGPGEINEENDHFDEAKDIKPDDDNDGEQNNKESEKNNQGGSKNFFSDDEDSKKPFFSDDEVGTKPFFSENEDSKKPFFSDDADGTKPFFSEDEDSKKPFFNENEEENQPTVSDHVDTKYNTFADEEEGNIEGFKKPPSVDNEEVTEPSLSGNADTKKPNLYDNEEVKKPSLSENEEGKISANEEIEKPNAMEHDNKALFSGDEKNKKLIENEEGNKPPFSGNEDIKKPSPTGKDKPFFSRDDNNKKPFFSENEEGNKPFFSGEGNNKKPFFSENEEGNKPFFSGEGNNKKPFFSENEEGNKPFFSEEGNNKKPFFSENEEGNKPFFSGDDNKKKLYLSENEDGNFFSQDENDKKPFFSDEYYKKKVLRDNRKNKLKIGRSKLNNKNTVKTIKDTSGLKKHSNKSLNKKKNTKLSRRNANRLRIKSIKAVHMSDNEIR